MTAATDTMPALPEPNAKLLALADRIDHDRLWARAGLERSGWTQEQHDRCDAGVELRRYAKLLGQDCWRIFPPRPGFCFSASTLDAVVSMARRDDRRRHPAEQSATTPTPAQIEALAHRMCWRYKHSSDPAQITYTFTGPILLEFVQELLRGDNLIAKDSS